MKDIQNYRLVFSRFSVTEHKHKAVKTFHPLVVNSYHTTD